VDINDQLRGSYIPDAWRRNRKWWWAIYLWTIGSACTNAYKIYVKVCDAHAVPLNRRLTHLRFQATLPEQLYKPESRVHPVESAPGIRQSPRKKQKTVAPVTVPPATANQKSLKSKPLDTARMAQAKKHYHDNPMEHMLQNARETKKICQVCNLMERTSISADGSIGGSTGKRSQKVAVLRCSACGYAVCGAECWNKLHGIDMS